eukprot:PhF_6_TR31729/c0_g1_i6/m.46698
MSQLIRLPPIDSHRHFNTEKRKSHTRRNHHNHSQTVESATSSSSSSSSPHYEISKDCLDLISHWSATSRKHNQHQQQEFHGNNSSSNNNHLLRALHTHQDGVRNAIQGKSNTALLHFKQTAEEEKQTGNWILNGKACASPATLLNLSATYHALMNDTASYTYARKALSLLFIEIKLDLQRMTQVPYSHPYRSQEYIFSSPHVVRNNIVNGYHNLIVAMLSMPTHRKYLLQYFDVGCWVARVLLLCLGEDDGEVQYNKGHHPLYDAMESLRPHVLASIG